MANPSVYNRRPPALSIPPDTVNTTVIPVVLAAAGVKNSTRLLALFAKAQTAKTPTYGTFLLMSPPVGVVKDNLFEVPLKDKAGNPLIAVGR